MDQVRFPKLSFFILIMGVLFSGSLFGQYTISTDSVIQTSTCPGGGLIVTYSVNGGSMNIGTPLVVEWSDGLGNFDNPDTIAQAFHSPLRIILTEIPSSATIGLNYRVRVSSVTPQVTGSANGFLPIIVTGFPGLADISVAPDEIVCGSDMVELTAGMGAANYRWSNGESGQRILVQETGVYSVTVSDLLGLCTYESDPIFIGVNPDPTDPTITTIGNVLVSSPAESYQWYVDGNPVSGATEARFRPQAQYAECYVEVTDEAGCVTRSIIMNLDEMDDVIPYPNPVSGELTVDVGYIDGGSYYWKLYRPDGTYVDGIDEQESVTGDYIQTIDMSGKATGIYILKVFAKGGVHSFRIQKID